MQRYLRRAEVESVTGKSTSRIYAEMKLGTFPRPLKIGVRSVAWRESDIRAWQAAKEAAALAQPKPEAA